MDPVRHEFTRLLMGVEARVIVWSADSDAARRGAAAAMDRIAAIEDVASDWRPSSEVMRLCASSPGEPRVISPDLMALLQGAEKLAMATGGAFDATVGAVTHLRRGHLGTGSEPAGEALASARARVDFRAVRLDAEARTATLLREGTVIDLGALAKGYAAGEALTVLRAVGLPASCVDLGGDLALGDPPPGAVGWRVGVPVPGGWQILEMSGAAVATSGDTQQAVIVLDAAGSDRASHIVEPATGRGVAGMQTVTIFGPDAMLCDGLATAVSVLGVERGLGLIERIPGYDAILVSRDGSGTPREHRTAGLQRRSVWTTSDYCSPRTSEDLSSE